jgi:hypothetical protein
MVRCIRAGDVKPLEDCPNCGAKEAKGHHPLNCVAILKSKLTKTDGTVVTYDCPIT